MDDFLSSNFVIFNININFFHYYSEIYAWKILNQIYLLRAE